MNTENKKNNKKKLFNIGIIGCGKIGFKRAEALSDKGKLVACSDIIFSNAIKLANKFGAIPYKNWKDVVLIKEIDIFIICTFHNTLSTIAKEVVKSGKHLLIEKPGAIKSSQISNLIKLQKKTNSKITVGYNHRFHPAIQKAKKLIDADSIGDLMFMRGRYGHGGRLNYNKEWRFDRKLSGGGQLMDQGSHMIDLSIFFLGDMKLVYGQTKNLFWKSKVEDNAYFILKNKKNLNSFIHVSSTEWKNLFSLEIYGKKGKLEISGLGGSYGRETLTFYKMLPKMGPPKSKVWRFELNDKSWLLEMKNFYKDISKNKTPSSNLEQSYKILKLIENIYKRKI